MSRSTDPGITARTDASADAVEGLPRWYSHPYNRPELYRLAAAMGWLPRGARLRLARRLGQFASRLFPVERAVIRRTLGRISGAVGPALDELTLGVFRDFAMCFTDLLLTNRQPAERLMAHISMVTGAERLTGLDGGLISLTAHVGNWELAGRLLARRVARQTHVVVAQEEIRQLERWLRREGDGVRFVPRVRPTVSVELVAALRRGEVVAIQGDRALGSRGDVMVPFFGCPAPFPIGPFRLARAAGVPVVPAFCLFEADQRYAVTVLQPMTVAPGFEEDAARSWVACLEEVVRRRPTQWFNFFDVWNPLGP